MWLSIISIVALVVLSVSLLIISYSWTQVKALPSELKRDLKTPEVDEQNTIIQVVGFSKLWFRKQFSLIDKELGTMEKSVFRTGLIAVREEYSEKDAAQTLHWQIEQARQQRLNVIVLLETASSNLLPLGLLVATCSLIFQLPDISSANQGLFGLPALCILAFTLFTNALALKPLCCRLHSMLAHEDRALRLCAEGLIMIRQHKTPAQVRALLEGMNSGFDIAKNVRTMEPPSNARPIREKNSSFFSNQRAS